MSRLNLQVSVNFDDKNCKASFYSASRQIGEPFADAFRPVDVVASNPPISNQAEKSEGSQFLSTEPGIHYSTNYVVCP
jgi:hypothetical protein